MSLNLSDASIDKIIQELNPSMNLGLLEANEKLYNGMIYGITVTEFIDGKKASPTIALLDWDKDVKYKLDDMAELYLNV